MIVIPMAGRSQRFHDAGYVLPKYALPLGDGTVFDHAIGGFRALFEHETFLFVTPAGAQAFVEQACEGLGVRRRLIVAVDQPTAGQGETVEVGVTRSAVADDEPLTIFNIDTFRPGFVFPGPWFANLAGWLEVFCGEGDNWSYVRPAEGVLPLAAETAEKRPISNLCCTGLYHFSRADRFREALAAERLQPQARELYVAPLFNHLIAQGHQVGWRLIDRDEVVFCGIPAEYQALTRAPAL